MGEQHSDIFEKSGRQPSYLKSNPGTKSRDGEWIPIAFASRYFNTSENKYSTDKLDEKFVVTSIESCNTALGCLSSRLKDEAELNRNENNLEVEIKKKRHKKSSYDCHSKQIVPQRTQLHLNENVRNVLLSKLPKLSYAKSP